MHNLTVMSVLALTAALCCGAAARAEEPKSSDGGKKLTDCNMTYSVQGWSAFYKTAKGEGKITCDNGQSAAVEIKVTGGGVTFGKSKIIDGVGDFSDVTDINELFGSYAAAAAHAGVVKSSEAAVYTKGEVSLALAGTGRGFDLGIAFGKFEIKRK